MLMKKSFPLHGILGILLLVSSEIFLFKKVNPFYSWFYCFAWWSYILIVDAIIYRLKGDSLFLNRTKEFLLMIPWSVFIWLIFEAANFSLDNWYYINLPHSTFERWSGYVIAYGTVLPGIFETTELLESLGAFRGSQLGKKIFLQEKSRALIFLGIFCLASSLLIPKYFFALIWVGFIFLLEPINYRFGGRSLLRDLEEGNRRKIYLLLTAGLICGLLWESWNYWAFSKWVYTVPFFEEMKGFEMPVLGFLGFPPFAVQAYVMYHFVSLFRFGRGSEKSTRSLDTGDKTRTFTIILTIVFLASFYVLVFKTIDLRTVDSFEARLQDAYWIDPHYQRELQKVGIATFDDMILRTKDKKERDELALRLLLPKEKLIQWVERARLVQLKGLGVENLRLLETLGIHSVSALASETPEMFSEKIEQAFQGRIVLRRAELRIWINEAKRVQSSEP